MKDIRQIREQFDLITEKEENEDRKLSALVRAGLYDSKKLPALKRALDKSADKITAQEKRMLVNLLDSLISQVVSDDQVYRKVKKNVHTMSEAKAPKMDTYSKFDPRYKAGYPTDKEMPSVLILKRKAIRVYPDNQKVALYYSQALDKYVTIPYNDIQTSLNEAKKDDDKKKRYVKPKKIKRDKSLPKEGSVKDYLHLVKGKGEHKSKLTRALSLRKQGLNIGGIVGIMMSDAKKKERAKASLAKVKAHMDKTRGTPSQAQAAPASKPAPASTSKPKASAPKAKPAASKASASTTGTIRKKSSAATKARMNKTLKKNPNATFSKGANRQAGIKEDFKYNLQMIREARQYGAADATLDAASFTPGPIGSAASLASAGMSLSRGDYTGAALDVAGAIPVLGYAAKGAKVAKLANAARKAGKAGKLVKAGKGLKAPSKLRRLLGKGAKAAALAGALAGAGGAGSGSNGSSSSASHSPDYNFSAKPTTSSSFASNKAASDLATHQRDVQLNRASQRALTKVNEAKKDKFALKPKTSSSFRGGTIHKTAQQTNDEKLSRQSQKAMMKEDNVLDTIRSIVDNNITEQNIQFDENKITINNTVAKKLLNVYESINKTNKKKMEHMLNESASSFNKVLMFAVRQ